MNYRIVKGREDLFAVQMRRRFFRWSWWVNTGTDWQTWSWNLLPGGKHGVTFVSEKDAAAWMKDREENDAKMSAKFKPVEGS